MIPNQTPGKRSVIARLIKKATDQLVVESAVDAATDPATASYADFMAKMRKEPRKARHFALLGWKA